MVTGRFGYLVVGRKEVSTLRGCRWVDSPLRLRSRGVVELDLTSVPTGCPVWTGEDGLGPNTVRILQDGVHWQLDAGRLTIYGEGDRPLGVYRELTKQERYDLIHD